MKLLQTLINLLMMFATGRLCIIFETLNQPENYLYIYMFVFASAFICLICVWGSKNEKKD